MNALIKQIRTFLDMSQTEFAEQLNVSFTAVNRWENGRSVPNKLAQTTLYELCKDHTVPVYDMTLERIKGMTAALATDNSRIFLYHGSKSGIVGPVTPKSRKQCDFGQGFYMGTEPSQALTLICDYEKAKFYIVSLSMDRLSHIEVPADINWALLVAYHRGRMESVSGTPLYEKYCRMTENTDIVVGSIANDRMFFVIDNFFMGNITDTALVNSLSALQLGKQFVAVSQKGCDAIRIEAEVELSHLERLFLKDIAEENRARGISLANDICKKHRREGMFFDEILENAKIGG